VDSDSPGLDRVSDAISGEGLTQPGICPLDLAAAGPESFQQRDAVFGLAHHLDTLDILQNAPYPFAKQAMIVCQYNPKRCHAIIFRPSLGAER
jgi:hypothetical protein